MNVKAILFFIVLGHGALQAQQLPYRNKNLSPSQRVDDLLPRMTLEEKVAQTQCLWKGKSGILDAEGAFDTMKAARLLPHGLGALARLQELRGSSSLGVSPRQGATLYNSIQRYFIEKTRLGIPVMVHEESLHGQQTQDATNFPVPIALASTWNEALLSEIFSHVAAEVRARGGHQVLAPVVDIVRDPRWGRTEETLGEDPFLTSRLAVAQVRAYQGSGAYLGKNKVAATLKHFGIHGQSEGGNNVAPSHLDVRTAREVFFPPFLAAIREAGVMGIMPTYNEIWGLPAHSNAYLLKDILRREWGFKGMVVSDYSAIEEISTLHRITPSIDEAGMLALKAGVDMETPDPDGYKNLGRLVRSGRLRMKDLDDAVRRILLTKFRLGLFDDPYVDAVAAEAIVGAPAKRAIAYTAAAESMVLLQNKGGLLPLDKNRIRTIAFIGPNADKCLLGGYSGTPRQCASPLQALRERAGAQMKVLYAEGVRLTDKNNWFTDRISLVDTASNAARIREAVAIAQEADIIVLFVGGNESMQREAWSKNHMGDLPSLDLLNGQEELVRAMTGLGKPVCAVVNSGPPLNLSNLVTAVPSVIQAWYLGQEGGYAIVDALFGDINPGGKLPISFPRSAGHIPAYYNYKPSARRGYHLGFDVSPLFAFGHGISYTTFSIGAPRLSDSIMKGTDSITVSVEVTNTGSRRGAEVVQLYIRDDYASVTRPVKELKGFQKVWLEPGGRKTIQFVITRELLSFYNREMKWVAEPGDFSIMTGSASDKLQAVRMKLTR